MRLGPYELVRLIGSGGMGEVWAAHPIDRGPQHLIAVKRLPEKLAREVTYRQILLDEARLSMLLDHPNIVNVFDAGEADGEAYIAMEFVHGLDLSRLRKILDQSGQRLPTTIIAHVIAEVLRGLDCAHNLVHDGELLSLIHRDISPHNVMLATNGEVKITDFGVARLATEDTSGTHVKGKARYMPPEQLRGDSRSPRVDLFAVGAILQELLDGVAFRSEAKDDARLLGMAVDGYVPPPLRPFELPRELAEVRARLLEPNPAARFQTARAALEQVLAWPGYRDASQAIADLIQGTLEAQVAAGNMLSHTDLARQPTELREHSGFELVEKHTDDDGPIDDFGGMDLGVGLEDMLLAPEDPPPGVYKQREPSSPYPASQAASRPRTGGHPKLPSGSHPKLPSGAHPKLPSGAHPKLPSGAHPTTGFGDIALDDDGIGAGLSASGAGLQLDEEVARPTKEPPPSLASGGPELAFDRELITTPADPPRPPPIAKGPRRPWGKYLVSLALVGGLGYGAYTYGPQLFEQVRERVVPEPDNGPSGLRNARIVGQPHPGTFAFGVTHMDTLTTDNDIFYDFLAAAETEAKRPLEALAAGEAEFALTTLDRLLLARADPDASPLLAEAKIIAVVDVSLGAHSLVLDAVEHPELRDLAGLAALARVGNEDGGKPLLGLVEGSASESLLTQLDALSSSLALDELSPEAYPDAEAVYEALLATPQAEPPHDEGGSETGEPLPPPPLIPTLDAAVLPAPWAARAIAAGMREASSSRELPYALVEVLVAPAQLLEQDPELVELMLGRYYESLARASAEQGADAAAAAKQLEIEPSEAAAALAKTCVLDAAAARAWMLEESDTGPTRRLATAVSATWAALRLSGRVQGKAPALAELTDTRALEAASAAPEHPTSAGFERCLERAGPPGSLGQLELGGLPEDSWFQPESSELSPLGQRSLASLGARLRALHPRSRVLVVGYGAGKKGKKLGQARAETLSAALAKLGLELSFDTRGLKAPEPDAEAPGRGFTLEL